MSDPLELIFTWNTETRSSVANALKPHVRIRGYDGEILWLTKQKDRAQYDRIGHLAKAVSFEIVGTPKFKKFKLTQNSAAELANKIWVWDSGNGIEAAP